MNDPIVEEIRAIRDQYAAQFNYDLNAIFQDIQQQQNSSGRVYIDLSKNKTNEPPPENDSET